MLQQLVAVAVCAVAASASGQVFYQASGGTVDFTKASFADVSDPANWDTITSNVAITRGNVQGLYNPLQESAFDSFFGSPLGTLWYFGATVQDVMDGTVTLLDFDDWEPATGNNPPATVGVDSVLYLEAEDAYVDIRFTQWSIGGAGGGGFAYTRAIVPAPGSAVILGSAALLASRRRRS